MRLRLVGLTSWAEGSIQGVLSTAKKRRALKVSDVAEMSYVSLAQRKS